jgi:serine/threonine-protein kinase
MDTNNWQLDETKIQEEAVVGRGRTGNVYRVRYCGAVMACKKLFVGAGHDRGKMEIFLRKEAKALSQLRHPNIIQLFGVCISDTSLALLMEFAGGGTVRDELDRAIREPSSLITVGGNPFFGNKATCVVRQGELPAWRKFEILDQLALAMRLVHSHGVVHQDIKPTNCMVLQVRRIISAKPCNIRTALIFSLIGISTHFAGRNAEAGRFRFCEGGINDDHQQRRV